MHPEIVLFRLVPGELELSPALALLALFAACASAFHWFARKRARAVRWALAACVFAGAALGLRSLRLTVGPLVVQPFGFWLALGLVLGTALAARLAAKAALDLRVGANLLVAALIGALLGARLPYASGGAPLSLLALERGGLSGYGALLAATLSAAVVTLRRARLDALRPTPHTPVRAIAARARAELAPWLDVGAVGALLCVSIARLGCYFAGCDYGAPLAPSAPRWLARLGTFPEPPAGTTTPVWEHAPLAQGASGVLHTVPLHPTELYEALAAWSIAALLVLGRSRNRGHGSTFFTAVLAYAALRLATELARGEPGRGGFASFSATQAIALVTALTAVVAWRRSRNVQRALAGARNR